MNIDRISAFSYQNTGGNPAGVAIYDELPDAETMLGIAKEIGYSETAFLQQQGKENHWRVRYFAPDMEIPFCGHATIALGAALSHRFGNGKYDLQINDGAISVSAFESETGQQLIALQSPDTHSHEAPEGYVSKILDAFKITGDQLDPKLPIRFANAGANHLVIPLNTRETLATMDYPFEVVKALMAEHDLITINLVWQESEQRFHSRNAFAAGGVVEDPATGAAAAALAGYLRDVKWSGNSETGNSQFEILQGFDMERPSRLLVEFDATQPGSSIRISGETYVIEA